MGKFTFSPTPALQDDSHETHARCSYPKEATMHFWEKDGASTKGVARPLVAVKTRTRKIEKSKKGRAATSASKSSTARELVGQAGHGVEEEGPKSMEEAASLRAVLEQGSSSESSDSSEYGYEELTVPFVLKDDSNDEDYEEEWSKSPSQPPPPPPAAADRASRRGRKRKASM